MLEGLVLNGRFRLIEKIDSGGMGAVWRAEDLELEAQAAVKLIDPELLTTPEALTRFQREAKAAAAIRSTHVVQILGYGVQPTDCGAQNKAMSCGEPQPYIAMELLKGETLAARLDRVCRLSAEEAIPILTHVARALSVAHAVGIVHRDLKPENVFLVNEMGEDVGKVLDFGVARHQSAFSKSNTPQTQSGAVLGTPYYMSPEQTVGGDVDARSDIWAFGVITYECLLGVRPFDRDTLGSLFNAICVAERPVPSKEGPVPDGFDAWFERTTARNVADRFQTIEECITALRVLCGQPARVATPPSFVNTGFAVPPQHPSHTPPPSARTILGVRRRRSRVLVLSIVAASVLGLIGIVTSQWLRQAPNTPGAALAADPRVAGAIEQHDMKGEHTQEPRVEAPAASLSTVAVSELPLEGQDTVTPNRLYRSTGLRGPIRATNDAKVKRASSNHKQKENVAGF